MLEEIEKLCKKIGKDLSIVQKNGGIDTQWPFIVNEIESYIDQEFIINLKKSIDSNDLDSRYPSAISQYVLLLHSVKHLDLNERIEITNKIIDIQKNLRKDYLCYENNQLIDFNISKYIENSTDQNKIKLISSLLFSFYEKIYPTLMRLGYEYHGPYVYENKSYIVKEYYDMDLLHKIDVPSFPFKNLKIIEEVDGYIVIDYFGHIYGDYKINNVSLFVDDLPIKDINAVYDLVYDNYVQLLDLQKDYTVSNYAISFTKNLFWTLDKKDNKYFPTKELLEKLKDFKLFFPREKIRKSIEERSIIDLEEKIFNSFLDLFKKK